MIGERQEKRRRMKMALPKGNATCFIDEMFCA